MRRLFAKILVETLVVCVIAWHLGGYFWFFDLFSHFVPYYLVTSLVLTFGLLLFHLRRFAVVTFMVFMVCAFNVLPLYAKRTDTGVMPIRVLQWNVLNLDYAFDIKVDWLKRQTKNADVIVLHEFTERWLPTLGELKREYPFQRYHIPSPGGVDYRGVAVLSRIPVSSMHTKDMQDDEKIPYMRVELEIMGKPLVFYAIHPPPPIGAEVANLRNENFTRIARDMNEEKAEWKFVLGDFNCTRYSYWFKKLTQTTGLRDSFEGFGIQSTWPTWLPHWAGVGIDQLLVSDRIVVSSKHVGPYVESDHRPVFTTLEFKPPQGG